MTNETERAAREAFERVHLVLESSAKRYADGDHRYVDSRVQIEWQLWWLAWQQARAAQPVAPAPSPSAPGYVLAPMEPTQAMCKAAVVAAEAFMLGNWESVATEEGGFAINASVYRAMLSAAPSQPSPMAEPVAWQPIMTAPLDGTRIVLATSEAAHAGRWAMSQYNGMWWMAGDYVTAFSKIVPPTHWMPLPGTTPTSAPAPAPAPRIVEALRGLADACLDTIACGCPIAHLDDRTQEARAALAEHDARAVGANAKVSGAPAPK